MSILKLTGLSPLAIGLVAIAQGAGAAAQAPLQPGAYEVRFLHGDTD